ncbi:MAG: LacI family DNA-binding transcriptional regulator [Verrucomicrobiota bacterium]|nr:LacI family DNA-binding transcriptional regulator [Verrucomicrobiota bacterium]
MSTLKQVAELANVHLATASAVLNSPGGNTRVGEETRNRILDAARTLGYTRNESARRLRTGSTDTVGFIGGDMRNPFFAELAAALEHELGRRGLRLLVSHVAPSPSLSLKSMVAALRQQMISRIIYWEEAAQPEVIEEAQGIVPLPIGFTTTPRRGVWLDLDFAIDSIVSYAAGKGMRRLGFYAPRRHAESPSVSIRWELFRQACKKRRLLAPVLVEYDGESWDIQAALHGATLAQNAALDDGLILGFNDTAALGLLLAAGANATRCQVVGFDGTPIVRNWPTNPPWLDLKLPTLAAAAVEAIVSPGNASSEGSRAEWIKPQLMG